MRRRPGECLGGPLGFAVRPARQRDARPFHAQCVRVGLPVRRIVQDSQHVVEQVLDTETEAVEIPLRRSRKIGTAFGAGRRAQALLAKPCGEQVNTPEADTSSSLGHEQQRRARIRPESLACLNPATRCPRRHGACSRRASRRAASCPSPSRATGCRTAGRRSG